MNFYDKIHELVKSFKETNEYKEFIALKQKIKANEEEYQLMKDFKEKQREHQMQLINGGQIDEKEKAEMQNTYSILIQKDDLRKLLECEMRLDILLADMQKIIADGIKEIVEF